MIFCVNNLITSVNTTITGGLAGFPITNLLSDRLNERMVFNDNIVIDFGSAQSINTLAVANSSQVLTIEANSSDSWGAPAFSQSMSVVTGTEISLKFIDEIYRYWRIKSINEARVGYIFIGNKLLIPDPRYGSIPQIENTDIEEFSISGQNYNTAGIQIKVQDFIFSSKTKIEYDRIKTFNEASYRTKAGIFSQTELNLDLFIPYFAKINFEFDSRRLSQSYNFKMKVREMK